MSREMKHSGIEWIGNIPSDWRTDILSVLFYEHKLKNKGMAEQNLLSLSYGNIIRKDITQSGGLLPESFETYNIVDKDDIIFRLTDLQNDKRSLRTGLCKERGIITSAYIAIRKRTNIHAPYFHYLFHTYDLCKVFYGLGDGVRQGMNYADMRKLPLIIPSYAEQKAIADFLDKKCNEIDELVALQEKMIEELKAYKQSVITEAVCKGLNPNVPMKDSGVEWIGEIPESWAVDTIGNLYTQRIEKVSDKDYPALSVGKMGVVPQLATAAKTDDGDNRKLVKVGDFAINSRSDRRGSCGISSYDGSVSLINIIITPRKKMNPQYYNWLFHSELFADEFYKRGHGIVDDLWTTRWQEMKSIAIIVPSHAEQQAIADFLDKKCSEIDQLISIKQQKIVELNDYKKSLIYEYATGKKEVKL